MPEVDIQTPILGTHNTYLSDQSAAIRARIVPWSDFQKANVLSEADVLLMKSVEADPKSTMSKVGLKCGFD